MSIAVQEVKLIFLKLPASGVDMTTVCLRWLVPCQGFSLLTQTEAKLGLSTATLRLSLTHLRHNCAERRQVIEAQSTAEPQVVQAYVEPSSTIYAGKNVEVEK